MILTAETTDTCVTIEPRIFAILEEKKARRLTGPYIPRSIAQVTASLESLYGPGSISGLRRMAGGASKEQFVFDHGGERLVLRMDPLEGLIETCRRREDQVLRAMHGVVPVPEVRHADIDGATFGLPALVTTFVPGVAKPPQAAASVSGLRTDFDAHWIALLAPAFIDNLVRIHGFDYRAAALPDFAMPDPVGGAVTAILDWELAHVGDFHEDLAWNLQPIFANRGADGETMISGLFRRDEFLSAYENASGRTVDPAALFFYDVLAAWKCAVIDLSSCLTAARDGNNHQDALLSWLATSAHVVLSHLTALLEKGRH
ncbi:phosphotransferase family protein [Novosphingobium sp. fls2-241-R2A-195]|uniref:phosphotransferase family protein n=1 Tax=Novosphingobium sp. fls2-241-R2A-195 TaxID=3040296 RepID=UPI00254FB48C|nr:phosphotransferase family protein [Novosphingobium sp. fls2-241-R2A-195]